MILYIGLITFIKLLYFSMENVSLCKFLQLFHLNLHGLTSLLEKGMEKVVV